MSPPPCRLLLLTPGPLATSARTRPAMDRDRGSREPDAVRRALDSDLSITDVAPMRCETTSGLLNPCPRWPPWCATPAAASRCERPLVVLC